jgi:hypothetical protein
VHPSIANPAPGLVVPSAPTIAVPDGLWNHGEGFGANAIDHGGWHDTTDGTNLTAADVHVKGNPNDVNPWVSFVWRSDALDLYPGSPHTMERMEGWLRPAGIPLPTAHPRYGPLPPLQSYVDQGAFEMFRPVTPWNPNTQRILVVVHTKETAYFRKSGDGHVHNWTHLYRGYFSPDGLVRDEPAGGYANASAFLAADNNDGLDVERPLLNTIASWASGSTFWPIETYAVISVPGRNATLNEQRHLQIAQAVRVLLQQNDHRNPVGSANRLTAQQVADLVDVVFVGGSNGGLASSLAMLRFPDLVHGAFAEVFNPSFQRFYAEFDRDRALTQLAGGGIGTVSTLEWDRLVWNQYAWSRGQEMHDLSLLRLFVKGKTWRPSCFVVADEDITSTGVNWARILNGSAWAPSGVLPGAPHWGSTWNTCGWTIGGNVRHAASVGPSANPYVGGENWHTRDIAIDWSVHARNHRLAEVAAGPHAPLTTPAHAARNQAQQLRGLDDPQEWWLGRIGDALPTTSGGALERDDVWNDKVNHGATGAVPGGKEAMFVHGQRVYVGSADGFVTRFVVDAANPKLPLVRDARSPRLGHECFAIAPVTSGGSSWIVAGTRRHLHKLSTGLVLQQSVQLPYEVGQPRHIVCADVLPGQQASGPEIVFASVHGGLCFYDLALNPLYEWPEPGIIDFAVQGSTVTILSARGVLANVTFAASGAATMTAISRAIPRQMLTWGAPVDPPSMGGSGELELMRMNLAAGHQVAAISLWGGDTDCTAGSSVRRHSLDTLQQFSFLPGLSASIDLATCAEGANPNSEEIGDHLLLLTAGNHLRLYDQFGGLLGEKNLGQSVQGPYTFGTQARYLAVGELVANAAEYMEEVVIATESGLMWMHVQEVKDPGTVLPATGSATMPGAFGSGFWIEQNHALATPLTTTHIQARTNRTLPMTWAMSRRPLASGSGLDGQLHVLDQLGNYWRVDAAGTVQLWRAVVLPGVRGWDFVGPVGPEPLEPLFGHLNFFPGQGLPTAALYSNNLVWTLPNCPKNTIDVFLERQTAPGHRYVLNNWAPRPSPIQVHEGFALNTLGGSLSPAAGGTRELWRWSNPPEPTGSNHWANLVEGMRIKASGEVDAIWASTLEPDPQTTKCAHHDLRSPVANYMDLTQQSIQAVALSVGGQVQTRVVLGCQGGRVRVLKPGSWRTAGSGVHGLGEVWSSPDLGHGGTALAVRVEGSGPDQSLRIWFGTIQDPDKRPIDYANDGGTLRDDEVSSGAIHSLTWSPGQPPVVVTTTRLHPTAPKPRGASAVVGLLVTDLLAGNEGDELVAGTLSGDIIVFDAVSMTELWRTHVDGSAGCFNSIRAENLDNDIEGLKELYVAGSFGLWRFTQPGENP